MPNHAARISAYFHLIQSVLSSQVELYLALTGPKTCPFLGFLSGPIIDHGANFHDVNFLAAWR